MTDRTQFEAMLEALINEDQETAKEIFHNIVVAKSREIYEELLESDFSEEAEEEESVEETSEEEESVEEGANPFADSEEEGEEEEEGDDEEGDDEEGDATDDFAADAEGEESEGDVEDRVMDLEDALEELKAEFEELMAGEADEPEHADEFGGEEPAMGGDDFTAEPEMDELAQFMEYVDKVALPKHGDNGANAKSVVAGKNDMGGTTANIAKGGVAKGEGTQGGLLNPKTQEENFGNVNVPGANAGKTAFKKKEPGHGAEKKGAADTAPDKKSIIGSRK